MPEGPSIVILKKEVKAFSKKQVVVAVGNAKELHYDELQGKTVKAFKSWGKHFLICFDDRYLRIHFLLFGSYRINQKKEAKPRLSLVFDNGEMNFYSCSVKEFKGKPDDVYDWSVDVMNKKWDKKKAREKLLKKKNTLVCDALLDQDIFAGVGNIIKNEVLYRIKVHPQSKVGALPVRKLSLLLDEAVIYSFDFLRWKKAYVLKKHWLAHTKTICLRCNLPIIKKYLGRTNRRTFFCENCQLLYK